jgi:AraC family transcriptional regulator, activator of mtrCDE
MTERSENDLLSEILGEYKLKATVFATPSVCGDWQVNTSGMHRVGFHLVGRGACWLHMRGLAAPEPLRAGDLLFLPGDHWHVLSPEVKLQDDAMRLADDGSGPRTELICGSISHADPGAEALFRALPEFILLRSGDDEGGSRLAHLALLLAAEASSADLGRQVALDRLADVLFVMVLRHVTRRGLVRGGLLAALQDPRLRRALGAFHAAPGEAWTLGALARQAGMSRTAFAMRFSAVVGEPPMQYLAKWRMQRAETLLRDRRLSVAQVAERLGYSTEAAFRRAFKRLRGIGPGETRRVARAGHQPL